MVAHPDRQFADYVVNGMWDCFRVGFNHSSSCTGASRNMQSAQDHPEVIRVYLEDECAKERLLGPVQQEEKSLRFIPAGLG